MVTGNPEWQLSPLLRSRCHTCISDFETKIVRNISNSQLDAFTNLRGSTFCSKIMLVSMVMTFILTTNLILKEAPHG